MVAFWPDFSSRCNLNLMVRNCFRLHFPALFMSLAGIFFASALVLLPRSSAADEQRVPYSDKEKAIVEQLHHLRTLPDDDRAHTTKELALQIRQLPMTRNKVKLAGGLAILSTEGDFGHDTLQEVATTLATALHEQPQPDKNGEPDSLYLELASLVRYEHVEVKLDTPQFAAAMAKLQSDDAKRQQADFTLTDLQGKSWNLKTLRG